MRDVELEVLDSNPPSTPLLRFCFEYRGRLTEVEGSARRSSVRGAEVSDDIPLQALMHAAPNRIRRPLSGLVPRSQPIRRDNHFDP
jgi:hypothetical protein